MTDVNTTEEMQKLAETRLQELIRCARINSASEIISYPGGIDITVDDLITTPLMRAAVSLQECYPHGGVYVVSYMDTLVLCVYYNMESLRKERKKNENNLLSCCRIRR